MINYDFKSYVLNSSIFKAYCKYRSAFYKYSINDKSCNFNDLNIVNYFGFNFPVEWRECERIYNAMSQKRVRLKKRINKIICCNIPFFLTFTFTDNVLNSTTQKTRRTYVVRWLKYNCCNYVGNIDFGKKNGREHYHACVNSLNNIDYTSWKYGSLNGRKIIIDNDCEKKLTRYICKLTNHAIKNTTKRYALIYSR